MKKIFAIMIIILLTGCGSKETVIEYVEADRGAPAEKIVKEYIEVEVPVEKEVEVEKVTYQDDSDFTQLSNTNTEQETNRKIIYRADLKLKSEDILDVYDKVLSKINLYGAYAENEYVSEKRFTMKLRVRTENFTDFIESLKGTAEVVNYNKTSEDITTKYSTFTAKKEALEAEHIRILELIATAEKLEDIIALEEFRAEIESELNYIGNELKKYDSLLEYSTVNLTVDKIIINEATIYSTTPTVSIVSKDTNSIKFKVTNNSEEDNATIFITILDNGNLVEELKATNLNPDSFKELEITNLNDDTEYKIIAISKELENEESKERIAYAKTDKTFMTELSDSFTSSIKSLGQVSRGLVLVVVALAPYLVIFGVISVPVIITMKNKRK